MNFISAFLLAYVHFCSYFVTVRNEDMEPEMNMTVILSVLKNCVLPHAYLGTNTVSVSKQLENPSSLIKVKLVCSSFYALNV